MKSMKTDLLFVLFLVVLGVMSRLLPHPWNFTAIGSMALFSGFSFRSNKALVLLPFVSLIISDSVLGFHDEMIYVYVGFAMTMVLSFIYFLKPSPSTVVSRGLTLSGLSVVSSFLFFLVTNFGVWIGSTVYQQTGAGLLAAYTVGLPFLLNQLAGDLFYTAAIFGLYEYFFSHRVPAKQKTIGVA